MSANSLPLFHFAESYKDSDQFYLTGFLCPDPFAVLELNQRKMVMAVSPMEYERAKKEARRGEVLPMIRHKGHTLIDTLVCFLTHFETDAVRVLPSFPVGLAQELKRLGIRLEVDGTDVAARRRKKSRSEIKSIESVQKTTEKGMEFIRSTLAGCPVKGGVLQHEGKALTAQRMRALVEIFFLERNLECADTIVAPGQGGADPHWRGEGVIRAGVPIVVDLFPRDRKTRFHADMSRTFCVGKASATARSMYDAAAEAQNAALSRLKAGVALADIHKAVCKVFKKRGYSVPGGSGSMPKRGFVHGTGHGLGLDIHEAPSVSTTADILEPGDVITVEPGLYDRRTGGVRIEDLVVCMPDGTVRNLTNYPRQLEIL
jgi:Xaa-Pro aminopeptidase